MLADPDVRLNLYNRNSLDKIIQNNSEKNTRSLDATEIITQACCTLNLRFCCHHLMRMIVSFFKYLPESTLMWIYKPFIGSNRHPETPCPHPKIHISLVCKHWIIHADFIKCRPRSPNDVLKLPIWMETMQGNNHLVE